MAAPDMPMSMGKHRNQSPNTLSSPPETTAPMARPGAPSFLMNALRKLGSMNRGKKRIIQMA